MRLFLLAFIGFALLAFAGGCGSAVGEQRAEARAVPADSCTFANPVAEGADPWVARRGGWYYLVESRENAIYVYKSKRLTDLKKNGVRVWAAPDEGWNQSNLWAPELHFLGGRWYVYYAAGQAGPPFIYQRSGVLQSAGADPQGTYTDKGLLYTGDDLAARADNTWAIDVTVARLDGQLYAVWSGWEENRDDDATPQHLYIARMSNPWTISSDRVQISSPVQSWEDGAELDLNEGPTFLQHEGETFILYSARESWLPAYQMGQLRLKNGANPMQAESWVKSGPVFSGTDVVHSVGHAGFTVSPDSTEDWIVYHTKKDTAPGWDRVIQTQPFDWGADGAPRFGAPVPPGQPLAVPSGASCA